MIQHSDDVASGIRITVSIIQNNASSHFQCHAEDQRWTRIRMFLCHQALFHYATIRDPTSYFYRQSSSLDFFPSLISLFFRLPFELRFRGLIGRGRIAPLLQLHSDSLSSSPSSLSLPLLLSFLLSLLTLLLPLSLTPLSPKPLLPRSRAAE